MKSHEYMIPRCCPLLAAHPSPRNTRFKAALPVVGITKPIVGPRLATLCFPSLLGFSISGGIGGILLVLAATGSTVRAADSDEAGRRFVERFRLHISPVINHL